MLCFALTPAASNEDAEKAYGTRIKYKQQQQKPTKISIQILKKIVRVSIFWFLICENLHKICRKWKYNAATVEKAKKKSLLLK